MSLKLTDDDAALAAKFSSLRTFYDVARMLDVTSLQLVHYTRGTGNYKVFSIKKKSGGTRTISWPATPLKIIQTKLNQVLHAVYRGRGPVHGFARGKSIVSNARKHVRRQVLLNFDLEDFFPSIHFGRVKGLFENKPYGLPAQVAVTLAQICCCNGVLPAGAPTSPVVANMICAQMDSQLKKLAIDCGSTYTRYADDLTFSVAHGSFPPPIGYRDPTTRRWVIGAELLAIVTNNKFKINDSKTRLLSRGSRQEVTGLVVGDRVNVKRTFVRQTRAMLHAAEKWGVNAASDEFHSKYDKKQRLQGNPAFLRVLRGKIEFVGAVRGRDDVVYLNLLNRYLRLDRGARAQSIVVTENASTTILERAIWLLEEKDGPLQGTGFALDGLDLVTAAHVVASTIIAACPALSLEDIRTATARKNDQVDVARLVPSIRPLVHLRSGQSTALKVGDRVKVLGFPLHRKGSSVHIAEGRITAFSPWHGVPHFVVDCAIVSGNSGGPVLNLQNEVVGIAVKGQGVPKHFGDHDELSRFVPIDFARDYLL